MLALMIWPTASYMKAIADAQTPPHITFPVLSPRMRVPAYSAGSRTGHQGPNEEDTGKAMLHGR